jgi:hypothetical protein
MKDYTCVRITTKPGYKCQQLEVQFTVQTARRESPVVVGRISEYDFVVYPSDAWDEISRVFRYASNPEVLFSELMIKCSPHTTLLEGLAGLLSAREQEMVREAGESCGWKSAFNKLTMCLWHQVREEIGL